jgi:predicted transcriptional regulator
MKLIKSYVLIIDIFILVLLGIAPCVTSTPVAVAKPDNQTVIVGEEAYFYGYQSYDTYGGSLSEHHWNFGDGNHASGVNTSHIYNTPGEYNVTLWVMSPTTGNTTTNGSQTWDHDVVKIIVKEPSSESIDEGGIRIPITVAVALMAIIVFSAMGAVFGTEVGKHKFFTFMIPLYTRLKKKEILDNYTRGMIRGYIVAYPGDHYNSIMKALKLKNGVFAYHIRVLEREKIIKSKNDGIYKRYYPYEMQIPNGSMLKKSQMVIIDIIKKNPGISQKEIARKLKVSPSTINYRIKDLTKHDIIRTERKGMKIMYFVNEGEVEEPENT